MRTLGPLSFHASLAQLMAVLLLTGCQTNSRYAQAVRRSYSQSHLASRAPTVLGARCVARVVVSA